MRKNLNPGGLPHGFSLGMVYLRTCTADSCNHFDGIRAFG